MSATRAAVGTSARHSFVYTNITPLRASLFLRVLLAPTRSPRLIKALVVRGWRHFAGAASPSRSRLILASLHSAGASPEPRPHRSYTLERRLSSTDYGRSCYTWVLRCKVVVL